MVQNASCVAEKSFAAGCWSKIAVKNYVVRRRAEERSVPVERNCMICIKIILWLVMDQQVVHRSKIPFQYLAESFRKLGKGVSRKPCKVTENQNSMLIDQVFHARNGDGIQVSLRHICSDNQSEW